MYKIYFAGDLFDQKHITGNVVLAKTIEKLSGGLYQCVIPQDWEGKVFSNEVEIRNSDLKGVMMSDLILLNFDGVDLDSGTVVEFMIAKMLDIPAVLLRTDCRTGGYLFDIDWNLMVAGFPRCVEVKHSAIKLYNDYGLEQTHKIIAQSVIDGFDEVFKREPILKSYDEIVEAYRHVVKMCGGGLEKIFLDKVLCGLVSKKVERKNIHIKHKQI